MDQIQREGQAVVGDVELRKALKKAHSQLFSEVSDPLLSDQILELADDISAYDTRSRALKEVLGGIALALE